MTQIQDVSPTPAAVSVLNRTLGHAGLHNAGTLAYTDRSLHLRRVERRATSDIWLGHGGRAKKGGKASWECS